MLRVQIFEPLCAPRERIIQEWTNLFLPECERNALPLEIVHIINEVLTIHIRNAGNMSRKRWSLRDRLHCSVLQEALAQLNMHLTDENLWLNSHYCAGRLMNELQEREAPSQNLELGLHELRSGRYQSVYDRAFFPEEQVQMFYKHSTVAAPEVMKCTCFFFMDTFRLGKMIRVQIFQPCRARRERIIQEWTRLFLPEWERNALPLEIVRIVNEVLSIHIRNAGDMSRERWSVSDRLHWGMLRDALGETNRNLTNDDIFSFFTSSVWRMMDELEERETPSENLELSLLALRIGSRYVESAFRPVEQVRTFTKPFISSESSRSAYGHSTQCVMKCSACPPARHCAGALPPGKPYDEE